jgi:hypothetical protein
VYIVWAIPTPAPSLYLHPPCFQAEPVLPSSPMFLKRRISDNKKDKAFLLVEIRIAIQTDSECCVHAQMCYNPN